MEQETLATELLREVKAQSKRWFIAFVVTVVLWFATIGAFLWYISLPVEEYEYDVDQIADDTYRSVQIVGGSNYGETEDESSVQETSNP
jgi:hypothetical protein